jgi:hypothetical protein
MTQSGHQASQVSLVLARLPHIMFRWLGSGSLEPALWLNWVKRNAVDVIAMVREFDDD